LRRVCLSSHTWLRSTGKCNLGSCIILVTKMVIQCLEWWNFIWNIPRHRRTKCNCPQGPSSKGKARGTKFVPVMFYCGDCMCTSTCMMCTSTCTSTCTDICGNIRKTYCQSAKSEWQLYPSF
jgi:hypothetical protein